MSNTTKGASLARYSMRAGSMPSGEGALAAVACSHGQSASVNTSVRAVRMCFMGLSTVRLPRSVVLGERPRLEGGPGERVRPAAYIRKIVVRVSRPRTRHSSVAAIDMFSRFHAMPLRKAAWYAAGQVEHLARHPAAERHAEQRGHQHRADARPGLGRRKCSRTMMA